VGGLGTRVPSSVSDFKDSWVFIGSLNLLCSQTTLDISVSTPVVAPANSNINQLLRGDLRRKRIGIYV
jgi:hypothetical protein